MQVKFKKMSENAIMPSRAKSGDLGFDLYAAVDVVIGNTAVIPTDIAIEFPEGWGGLIKDRSSMASRGLFTSGGVIDQGYRGSISVILTNTTPIPWYINTGDRIAQLVPTKVSEWELVESDILNETTRGSDGFGSTGK